MIVRTIDAHVGGAALRLVVDGGPVAELRAGLPGGTIAEALEVMRTRHDAFRRALMLEPRGHGAMSGAILTPAESAASSAGVLFMHAGGWSAICGHGLIAVAAIAVERGLLPRPAGGRPLRLDTAAGPVDACVTVTPTDEQRVASVAWSGVSALVVRPGLSVPLARREVAVDVAHAGETYAIADAESCGVPLDREHLPELVRTGQAIVGAVEAALGLQAVAGTVFTGPPAGGGDLRAATVYPDGAVDRSPGGMATCAVMAVLDAMGLLSEDQALVLESLIGTRFTGRIASRTQVGETPAIVPEIEGRAFITGEHAFTLGAGDPLRDGFVFS